jgi:hypothetical protein
MQRYRKYFASSIKEHYPVGADIMTADLGKHYTLISTDTKFAVTSNNPLDRRLDFCA